VTPQQLTDARRELQRVRPGGRIQGPVVFKSGRFGLISSVRDPQGGLSTQVLGMGAAPLLDGEQAAVSIQLTKQGAKLLWESFATPTPDISFSFEMDLSGFRGPQRALLEANFDQVYEHQAFSAGLAATQLAAEIRATFDDLRREGAIKLTQIGSDTNMDNLINTAYSKLIEMMFQPVGGSGTPDLAGLAGAAGGQPSLLDRATNLLSAGRADARAANERARAEGSTPAGGGTTPAGGGTPAGSGTTTGGTPAGEGTASGASRPTLAERASGVRAPDQPTSEEASRRRAAQAERTEPSFAVVAAYEFKRIRQRGIFRIDLNKYTADTISLRFDENIGDLRSLRGDEGHFREVNITDNAFSQREITAFVDGLNTADFGSFVNFVTVELRKKHEGGQETRDEVRIDRNNFNATGNAFKLLYGKKGDVSQDRWFDYEWKANWSFFGGREVEGAWKTRTAGAIPVVPPYQKRAVDIEADPTTIAARNVRLITAKILYDLGDGVLQEKEVTLNPSKNQLSARVEFILPAARNDYQYEIAWRLRDGTTLTSGRRPGNGSVLFADELP
jgi:hypothetical protein